MPDEHKQPNSQNRLEARLSDEERAVLLQLARQALERGVNGLVPLPIPLDEQSPRLREPGATFVTLTKKGLLRGCIGALEPYQSLVKDVQEHAIAAAMNDYRFPPVRPEELDDIDIEISYLSPSQPLIYETPQELLTKLRPNVDGVILRDGMRRATFLPQVWEKIPQPTEFLAHLCQKMGASPDLWTRKKLDVLVYQVEEFHE